MVFGLKFFKEKKVTYEEDPYKYLHQQLAEFREALKKEQKIEIREFKGAEDLKLGKLIKRAIELRKILKEYIEDIEKHGLVASQKQQTHIAARKESAIDIIGSSDTVLGTSVPGGDYAGDTIPSLKTETEYMEESRKTKHGTDYSIVLKEKREGILTCLKKIKALVDLLSAKAQTIRFDADFHKIFLKEYYDHYKDRLSDDELVEAVQKNQKIFFHFWDNLELLILQIKELKEHLTKELKEEDETLYEVNLSELVAHHTAINGIIDKFKDLEVMLNKVEGAEETVLHLIKHSLKDIDMIEKDLAKSKEDVYVRRDEDRAAAHRYLRRTKYVGLRM
jgi:hypothetical protein